MDSDRIKGQAQNLKGKLKEAKADLTDDTSKELRSKGEQIKGKAQESFGRMKDEVRSSMKKGEERRTNEPGDEDEL